MIPLWSYAPEPAAVLVKCDIDEAEAKRILNDYQERWPGIQQLHRQLAMHEETPLPHDGPGKSRRRRN